jgi:hypothetical protein
VAHLLVNGRRTALESTLQLLAAGTVGIVILGWAPYVLNLLRFGHPFYPLMGHGAVDIMTGNTPAILVDLSRPARFLFSLFAGTHAGYETTPALKLPLALSWAEIRTAGGTDVRIGGFGPLFSAVVLLATIVVALQIVRRQFPVHAGWLLYVGAVVLLSVLAMPENWWARYVPQFWLVPWIVTIGALLARARWLRAMGWALGILMLVDASMVAAVSTAQAARRSMAVSEQIAVLKRAPGAYCVAAELAQSRIAILQAAGVDARSVAQSVASNCAAPSAIASYGPDRFGGRICFC